MRLNWANFLFIPMDGYGRLGLGFVRALLQAGHEVHPFTIDEAEKPGWFQQARGLTFDRVTVQLMPPHEMKHLPGRSVGFSMHESGTLPRGWGNHVNQKCEYLIVPSPWLIEVFENAGVKVPIEVVPGGIHPDEFPILPPRRNQPYTYGCLGDRAGRKGDSLVYTAFYKVFGRNNRDVRLIIKCRPSSKPRLDFSYSTDDRLTLWRADVETMADVYAQMDAFIFPTHCEGLGMPPLESAASGIPTVVTNWSGTADDCDKWAFPLNDYKLVESHMEDCGGLWAQPSLDEICETMLWLYEHQDDAKQQAIQKAQWLRQHRTYAHSVDKLLRVLASWFGGPMPEPLPPTDEEQQQAREKNSLAFALLKDYLPVNGNGVSVIQ